MYCQRKKIQPHGAKTGDSGSLKDVLIIPLFDESLKLVNLQFVRSDGAKRFLSGGKKKGCFWWAGKKTPTVLIAEGFATAASLHEHTEHQVFIAFDAGNLASVSFKIYPSSALTDGQRVFLKSHKAEIIEGLKWEQATNDKSTVTCPDDRHHCRECRHLINCRCIAHRFKPCDTHPRRCADFAGGN